MESHQSGPGGRSHQPVCFCTAGLDRIQGEPRQVTHQNLTSFFVRKLSILMQLITVSPKQSSFLKIKTFNNILRSCLRERCDGGRGMRRPCLSAAMLSMTPSRYHFWNSHLFQTFVCFQHFSGFIYCFFIPLVYLEKVSESSFRGGDICPSWSGVHSSFREKCMNRPPGLDQEWMMVDKVGSAVCV